MGAPQHEELPVDRTEAQIVGREARLPFASRSADARQDLSASFDRRHDLPRCGRTLKRSPQAAPAVKARKSLRHRHPAAQRDRLAAYGACAQQHAAGRALSASNACAGRDVLVAAGHRSCRHRHADGGRAAIDGAAGAGPPRSLAAREVREARLAMEGRVGRQHHQSVEAARRLLRLVARTLHHGRGRLSRAVRKVFVDLYRARTAT